MGDPEKDTPVSYRGPASKLPTIRSSAFTELLIRDKIALEFAGPRGRQFTDLFYLPPTHLSLCFFSLRRFDVFLFFFFLASLGEYTCVWEWMPESLLKRRKTEGTTSMLFCYKHGLIPLCSCQRCFGPWAYGHGLVFRATYGTYIKFTVPSWKNAVFVNHLGEGWIYGRGKTHPVKPLNTGSHAVLSHQTMMEELSS